MNKKLIFIAIILVVAFVSLAGCGSNVSTTSESRIQNSEQEKIQEEADYIGTYSQSFESDDIIGACDDSVEGGCKYEVSLTSENIAVYYTNSVGTTMVWYGNVSTTDITEKYSEIDKAYSIVSTLDSDFSSKPNASTAMFGYEGHHKEFKYIDKNGTKHIEMDVPDSSEDAIFDTTNINLYFLTKDVI